MTSLGRQDGDLHLPDGTHLSTAPSSVGHMVAQFERRLYEHLAEHARVNGWPIYLSPQRPSDAEPSP